MTNQEIARALSEAADLIEIDGGDPYRARAFRVAARAVERLDRPVSRWDDLTAVRGIGPKLAAEVAEIDRTGDSETLRSLRASLPGELPRLLAVPGLGPRRLRALWTGLGVTTPEDLERACRHDRVRSLRGFGARTQEALLRGVLRLKEARGLFLLGRALPVAEGLCDALARMPEVSACAVAGSLRRGRPLVKDADLVAAVPAAAREAVAARFVTLPGVEAVRARGDTRVAVALSSGLGVDLRMVEPAQFASGLHHFTGSREHHVALRARARRLGLSISEYGVSRDGGPPEPFPDEDALYRLLGLHPIPPELREGRGEVEAAERGPLPELVEARDLKGLLHVHTQWSDGRASVEDMARAARARGFGYVAVTDHSQAASYASGLDPERLERQGEEIAEAERRVPGVRVLRGIEVDVLPDGRLDLPDAVLARLDVVIASVHSAFGQPRDVMTRRVIRAVENPLVTVLGHPTGRLLLARAPYDVDLDAVFEAAARTGTFLEVDGNPHRLDLDDEAVRRARARGVRFALDPDAHTPEALGDVRYALAMARRAGVTASEVLNALPAEAMVEACLELRARKGWKGARPSRATPKGARPQAAGGAGASTRKPSGRTR